MILDQPSHSTRCQNALVETVYRRANCVAAYSSTKLLPPEASAIVRYRDDIVNRRVLDLGCGAGRLAVYLQPLAAHYTGLDISAHMIAHCSSHFDGGQFIERDIRDLNGLNDASFDAIFAISNLFDAVSHDDRLQVLTAVRRVLIPSGLLIFSTHNRNYALAGEGPRLEWHRNPIVQIRKVIDFTLAIVRHRIWRKEQRFEELYALLNDSGNNFASLHYYITREAQLRQLVTAGFRPLECFDSRGRTLTEGDEDSESPCLHYVARRNS